MEAFEELALLGRYSLMYIDDCLNRPVDHNGARIVDIARLLDILSVTSSYRCLYIYMLTRRSFLAAFLFSLPTVETARPCTGIKL